MSGDAMSTEESTTVSGIELPESYRREGTETPPNTFGRRIAEGLKTDRKMLVGAVVVLLYLVVAVFAPFIAPHSAEATFGLQKEPDSYSMADVDDDGRLESVWHPLGTDSFGRDILSRIIFGARVSMLVAFATVAFAFAVGTTIGLLAGYYKGWIDSVLMRYVDFQWAFPEIILAVGIIALSGGLGVWNVVIAIGLAFVDDFARLIRSEVLSIREEEYVIAARAIGMSDVRILTREIVPNAVASLIVQATVMIPIAIIAEASLSFLGLGVKPSTPTWGLLMAQGRDFITQAWWISVIPGVALMICVFAFNLVGDGLRDAFDIAGGEVQNR